jgi:outer membrane immunogenic protein
MNLRTVLTASVLTAGALMTLALPAQAADMSVKARPMAAPPPVQNWYGFYVGVHAGYAWGGDGVDFTGATGGLLVGANIPGSLGGSSNGFIGGIQWGSNYQFDRIVLGFDSDFSYMDRDETQSVTLLGVTTTANQSLDWFGTTRLRAGFLVTPNVLLYAAGGLASGSAEVNVSQTGAFVGAASVRDTLWGWTLGGGIEFLSGPWMFRVEYLHYDLGDIDFTYAVAAASTVTTSTNFSGDIVRAGISYKFNWTPLGVLFGRDRF